MARSKPAANPQKVFYGSLRNFGAIGEDNTIQINNTKEVSPFAIQLILDAAKIPVTCNQQQFSYSGEHAENVERIGRIDCLIEQGFDRDHPSYTLMGVSVQKIQGALSIGR